MIAARSAVQNVPVVVVCLRDWVSSITDLHVTAAPQTPVPIPTSDKGETLRRLPVGLPLTLSGYTT